MMLSRLSLASLARPSASSVPSVTPRLLSLSLSPSLSPSPSLQRAHVHSASRDHNPPRPPRYATPTPPPMPKTRPRSDDLEYAAAEAWAQATPHGRGRGRKFKNKHGHTRYATEPKTLLIRLLEELRDACEHGNMALLQELYPTLRPSSLLTSLDTFRICQALHLHMRALDPAHPHMARLLPFFRTLVADMRDGSLHPHYFAYVHVLGIFKHARLFTEGGLFWQWLVDLDDTHVNQAVYGAAMELLAVGRLRSLADLELLYADCLKRFPGTFAEYHFSPDAIVPDRASPITIAGLPITALQGIVTARLLDRDWKKAYLGFDTALRLYPHQLPPRYFDLFMHERPLAEAYTAFLLACRAGTRLSPALLTDLLTKMRAAIKATRSLQESLMLLRAMANAIYAAMQVGMTLRGVQVGIFILAFESLLPGKPPNVPFLGEEGEIRNIVVSTAHQLLGSLLQSGLTPTIHPFRSLLTISGKLAVPDLLTATLKDIEAAGIEFSPADIREAITAAGRLGNSTLVESLWSGVVASFENKGVQPEDNDWAALARACRRTGKQDYVHDQMAKLAHTLGPYTKRAINKALQEAEVGAARTFTYDLSSESLANEMDLLKAQLKNIQAVLMSGTPLDAQQSPFYMHINPNRSSLGSEEHLRAVYNDYTTDPHQPSPPPPAKPVRSSSGIPLDELRFLNWVTVHEMMADAEAYESEFEVMISTAISLGQPVKRIPELMQFGTAARAPADSKEALHAEIKSLRTPLTFRKLGAQDVTAFIRSTEAAQRIAGAKAQYEFTKTAKGISKFIAKQSARGDEP